MELTVCFSFLDGDFFSLSLSLFLSFFTGSKPVVVVVVVVVAKSNDDATRRKDDETFFCEVLKRCDEIVVASKKI